MTTMQTIGGRIKELRTFRALTLDQLANLIQVDTSTLWRYETGTIKTPSIGVLQDLCQVFQVSMSDFFQGMHEEPAVKEKTSLTRGFQPDDVVRRIAALPPEFRQLMLHYLEFCETQVAARRSPFTSRLKKAKKSDVEEEPRN